MNSPLEQIVQHLREMRPDMERLARIGDFRVESQVLEYIEGASLEICKDIVDALACRVEALCGDALTLRDASEQLESEIDAQDNINNPPLCSACNGSGEGQYDGTRCRSCGGSGADKS